MIEGVTMKTLVTHADDRGFFREIARVTDDTFTEGFGQLSHSLVHPGVIKAWHGHRTQTQWTYIVCGLLRVAVHDRRPASPTFGATEEWLFGDHHISGIYRLPPGVVHGYRCLAGPAHVIYVTSGTYDTAEELRLSHDDPAIGYDWTRPQTIR